MSLENPRGEGEIATEGTDQELTEHYRTYDDVQLETVINAMPEATERMVMIALKVLSERKSARGDYKAEWKPLLP